MKKLYLVRHGQTYFNLIGKTQGWCDSPLTEKGQAQVKKTREWLISEGLKFSRAYTSTLGRARESTRIISQDLIQEVIEVESLKELGFGRFEGESNQILPSHPFKDKLLAYGGEDEDQALARFEGALVQILSKEDQALVISHGTLIREFGRKYQDLGKIPFPALSTNGSVQIFLYDGKDFYLEDYISFE